MIGFYRLTFTINGTIGFGVLTAVDGKIYGGGTTMHYVGSYRSEGTKLFATVKSGRHATAPGMTSISGHDEVTYEITAESRDGVIRGTGSATDRPGIEIEVSLSPIIVS